MDIFFTAEMTPFTIALAVFAGLLLLEIVLSFVGGSLLGGEAEVDISADAPELDLDLDVDMDVDLDLDADLDAEVDVSASGASSVLGLGDVPMIIWVATLLLSFGLLGFAIQTIATSFMGAALPAWLASLPAGGLSLAFVRGFSKRFARFVPKLVTQSVSEKHLGRRRGVITVGTARRGSPAEVRVTDRYGNTHYLRAEPLNDDAVMAQGSEVIVMRATAEGKYFLVAMDS